MAMDVSNPTGGDRPIETGVRKTHPVALQDAINALDEVTAVWAGPNHPPLLASGRAARVSGSGPDRFQTVKAKGRQLFDRVEQDGIPLPARPRLFGGFSFFDTPRLADPWSEFEPAGFLLPAVQITLSEDRTWITGFGQGATTDRLAKTVYDLEEAGEGSQDTPDQQSGSAPTAPADTQPSDSVRSDPEGLRAEQSTWTDRVRAVRDIIAKGDLQKAVLAEAFDLKLDGKLDIGSVLADLETRYPKCYRFSFTAPTAEPSAKTHTTFFGASPERLVEKRGRSLSTEALAGTVKRGTDLAGDQAQTKRLLGDQTLATEHDLVADRITEQLRELGATVEVGSRTVRTLANVHHLQTPIAASLPQDVHVLDLVELLHPTPAVGGLPTAAARDTIAEIESTVRGWYGAPVGWFDAYGDGTFAVGIRSALAKPGRATLFAGNGIVAGSDPETEWSELEAKFEPIREVLE
ncbi:isochorismate synthase [Halodesulfurarchaeum sp.]|uniref:isochorismate synthase n=1 Tax=Halodesulfurarchaeum sp. TaxID=1980530 RepID=UPI002FC2AF13